MRLLKIFLTLFIIVFLSACASESAQNREIDLPIAEEIISDSESSIEIVVNLSTTVSAAIDENSVEILYGDFPNIEPSPDKCLSGLLQIFGPFDLENIEVYLTTLLAMQTNSMRIPPDHWGPGNPFWWNVLILCSSEFPGSAAIEGIIRGDQGETISEFVFNTSESSLVISTEELTINFEGYSLLVSPNSALVDMSAFLACIDENSDQFGDNRGPLLTHCLESPPGAEILAPYLGEDFVVFEPHDQDLSNTLDGDHSGDFIAFSGIQSPETSPIDDDPAGDFITCGISADPNSIGIEKLRPAEFLHALLNLDPVAQSNIDDDPAGDFAIWPCRMLFTLAEDGGAEIESQITETPSGTSLIDDYVNGLAALRIRACIESVFGADRANSQVIDNVDPDEWSRLALACPDLAQIDYGQAQIFVQLQPGEETSALFGSLPDLPSAEWLTFVLLGDELLPVFLTDADGQINSIEGVSTSTTGFYLAEHLVAGNNSDLVDGLLIPLPADEDQRNALEEVTHLINPLVFPDGLEEVTHLIRENPLQLSLQDFSDVHLDGIIIQDPEHGIILQDPDADGITIQDPYVDGIIIENPGHDGLILSWRGRGEKWIFQFENWIIIQDPGHDPIVIQDPAEDIIIEDPAGGGIISVFLTPAGDLVLIDKDETIIIQDPEGPGIIIQNDGSGWIVIQDPDSDGIELAHEGFGSVSLDDLVELQDLEGDPDRPIIVSETGVDLNNKYPDNIAGCTSDTLSKDDVDCFCQYFPEDDVCIEGKPSESK